MSTTTQFDPRSMARWYAKEHMKVDSGVRLVHYLPTDSPPREIRLVEVNDLIAELNDNALEPVDFGVDRGLGSEHKLFVLDVTPGQWQRIGAGVLPLPPSWSLDGAVLIQRN